jgi:hypothetical protein
VQYRCPRSQFTQIMNIARHSGRAQNLWRRMGSTSDCNLLTAELSLKMIGRMTGAFGADDVGLKVAKPRISAT